MADLPGWFPDWDQIKNSRLLWYSVTTIIFAWLILSADIERFLGVLRTADYRYMVPASIVGLGGMMVMGLVWHRFFSKIGIDTSLRKSEEMFMAGNLMNSITPLGPFGGEPFMAYIVSSNTDSSYEKSLSAVISSDLVLAIPFITFLVAGVIYMAIFGFLENFLTQLIILTSVSLGLLISVAYLLWFDGKLFENLLVSLAEKIGGLFDEERKIGEKLKAKIRGFKSALNTVGESPGDLIVTVIIGHLAGVLDMFALFFVVLSLNLEPSLIPIYFTITIGTLGYFSPTPGGSGAFETVFAGLMMFFYGVTMDVAVAAAILFRVATYWIRLPFGYFSLLTLRSPDR